MSSKGFSLIEAMLSGALFSVVVTAFAGAMIYGQQSTVGSGERGRAMTLAEEGTEAVRSIRDQALNELQYNQSGVQISGNTWAFLGEGSTETIDEFTRTTTFADVCRNGSKVIAACPSTYTDPHSKKVTVTVTWSNGPTALPGNVSRVSYLTDWAASSWTQTDWVGGSAQALWSDATKYDSDDSNVVVSAAGQVTLAAAGGAADTYPWWNTAYGYREKITFGAVHSALPQNYTATFNLDTRIASTHVLLASGNDVRVVWQPSAGAAVELDRIGTTWNNAATAIDFRLQTAVTANSNESASGSYYAYYSNAAAGTPPTNEKNVYYFADFFNRSNSSTVGNGWTEWTNSGNVSIASNAAAVTGNRSGPAGAGIKQNFALGAIPSNFTVQFDWTMPSHSDTTWTHYLNIGNSSTMSNSSRTTGVGPGIYNGEGSWFSPNGTENVSNDLTGNMENNVNGGPYAIKMVVNTAARTYDYYRGGTLIASSQNYVTNQSTLNQIRIATDQYNSGRPAFVYDNLKLTLDVATDPTTTVGSEQVLGSTALTDNSQVTFNAGTYANTQYNTGTNLVELTSAGKTAGTGTFTSAIDDAGATTNWSTIDWVPNRPAGKELPNGGATETGYPTGNVSMTGNQVLYHMNESAGATSYADGSGNSRNATCVVPACPTATAAGILNTAPLFDGSVMALTAPVDLSQWLGGTSSLSAWFKTTQVGNATFYLAPGLTGVEQNGGGNDIFWGWLDDTGKIGFQVGDGAGVKSLAAVNNGAWHHIAMTRDSVNGQITLYIDGAQQAQTTSDTGLKTTPFSGIGTIGDTGGSPTFFGGQIDEFAVWNRVLSSTEVTDVYQRAALNLQYQVRSCNDAACSGEIFIGPNGTGTTYYSELSNSTATPPSFALTNVTANRWLQYRATLTTIDTAITPEIKSVSISYPSGSGGGSGFVTAGSLQSSALNMADASPVENLEWDQTVPSCSPACSIRLQVRTAPNAAGAPGTWTAWYGATGAGTYFTVNSGELIPVALNGNQWVQYRVELAGDGTSTPTLQEVRLFYR